MKKITQERITGVLIRYLKNVKFYLRNLVPHTIPIFVMGYGRSGSSMLFRVFERDMRLQTYGENHQAVACNYLLNFDRLERTIAEAKADAIVLKPILNSFMISKMLVMYPDGIFIWLVRNYQDVVASALKKFGPVVANYMKEFVEQGTGDNWIAKTIPGYYRNEIAGHIAGLSPTVQDWMALVWWAVNSTIIREKLNENYRVIVVRYEELVQNPEKNLIQIYNQFSMPYQLSLGKYIHPRSIGKGNDITISGKVAKLCSYLDQELSRLN